jgi:WD40 repeat protein
MDTREDVARRVREALSSHTALVDPAPDSLARLRERIAHERARRRSTARWVLTSGAVAAAVVAVLVIIILLPRGSQPVFTPPVATDTLATPAPTPAQVVPPEAFAAITNARLVVVDVRSGKALHELPNVGPVTAPLLTADGRTAFGLVENDKLVRVDLPSRQVSTVVEARSITGYFATPDGRRLGYVRQLSPDGPPEAVVVGEQKVLTSATLRAAHAPALSPDGTRLAFIGDDPNDLALHIVDLARAASLDDSRSIAHPAGCAHQAPVWVAGGLFAIQVCGQSGTAMTNTLVRLDPDAGTATVVAELPAEVSALSGWSDANGTKFLRTSPDGVYLTDLTRPAGGYRVPGSASLGDARF